MGPWQHCRASQNLFCWQIGISPFPPYLTHMCMCCFICFVNEIVSRREDLCVCVSSCVINNIYSLFSRLGVRGHRRIFRFTIHCNKTKIIAFSTWGWLSFYLQNHTNCPAQYLGFERDTQTRCVDIVLSLSLVLSLLLLTCQGCMCVCVCFPASENREKRRPACQP